MQRKYKYVTVSMLLIIAVLGLISGLKIIGMADENVADVYEYVEVPSIAPDEPVTNTEMRISKPFTGDSVSIAVDYYDKDADNQEQSIIVTDKVYMQNVGVLYGSEKAFDVLCILDGNVTKVGKNELIGNYVQITHSNNMVSVYQILDNITIQEGDYIKQGAKIGTSSTSVIKDGNLLLFELLINNQNVDPEEYYNKLIKEI